MTAFALLPDAEAARLRSLPLSYPVADGVPAGYESFSRSAVIGHGQAAFAAAVEAVLSWQVQRRSGIAVTASDERVRPGTGWLVAQVAIAEIEQHHRGRTPWASTSVVPFDLGGASVPSPHRIGG